MPYARRPTRRSTYRSRAPARKNTRTTRRNTNRSSYTRPSYRKRRPNPAPILGKKPALSSGVYRPAKPGKQIGFLPFAQTMHVRLPWVWNIQGYTSPAGATAGAVYYRLNSLYDPDSAAGGHQPMQYDQLTGIYRSYLVHACKIELEFTNPSADGLFVGYGVYDSALTTGSSGKGLDYIGEMRNAVMKPLNNSGSQTQKFSIYVPINKIMQVPKVVYTSDRGQYASPYNASPTAAPLLEVLVLSTTGSAISCNTRMRLVYYAEMFDSITQAQS
ncbi:MAG: capsid protein [Incitativirus reperis]|uniref:Capsid protein n=1 Tax=Cressdnaviricota sp. TaxID=2748378 RepID=A0A345MRT2_9VIRU|nr:MAG: capsid protein [Cressdnaviricota sp.]